MIDKKIEEICERKKFTNFWEAFDFMKMAGYSEIEAIMIGLEIFEGHIWNRVINAAKVDTNKWQGTFITGMTYNINITNTASTSMWFGVDAADSEDMDIGDDDVTYERQSDAEMVELFIMTEKANPFYMPIYKAYVETRKYETMPELDEHIKSIKVNLTTELAIKIFSDGYSKFK